MCETLCNVLCVFVCFYSDYYYSMAPVEITMFILIYRKGIIKILQNHLLKTHREKTTDIIFGHYLFRAFSGKRICGRKSVDIPIIFGTIQTNFNYCVCSEGICHESHWVFNLFQLSHMFCNCECGSLLIMG